MKILVVCQYYSPEPVRITDICEELVSRGHEVTVVTGIPNYPMGIIYDGYRGGKHKDEIINSVRVHRCFTVGRRKGVLWRVLNYYSFALSSTRYISRLDGDYDVVLINQLSPVMMANAAIKYKKKHKKKIMLYCLDIWPESLIAGGVKRDSAVYRLYKRVSKRIYDAADRIAVTSAMFTKYFKDIFNTPDEALLYLPQYSEDAFNLEDCAKLKDDTVDLMFAGNIGAAQSVDTIIRAAKLTENFKSIRWHIVGDGSEYEACKALSRELNTENVIFHGRKPLEEMPKYYSMADVMLVTLFDDPIISLTLPGKVQTYMAAGKPILAAASGEIDKVVTDSGCGICCPAQDSEALAAAAISLAENGDFKEYAANSYRYYQENFSKKVFFENLERELENLR